MWSLSMSNKEFIKSKLSESITELPDKGLKKKGFINSFKEYHVHLLGRDE